jgi:alpha 1,2-mannosyltransferase
MPPLSVSSVRSRANVLGYRRVSVLTKAPIHFGQIPHDHWYQPDWIDESVARKNRLKMMAKGIIYAGL